MSEYKLFVQRIGLIGLTNILVSLSSIILLPIITKNLSIQDYGIWVQVNITMGLIPVLATFGLPYSMVRFLASMKDKEKIQEGFYSITLVVVLASLIISLFMFLFSKIIAESIFGGNLSIALLLPFMSFVCTLSYVIFSYFRTFQQMKLYSLFTFLQAYLTVGVVAYIVAIGYGIFEAIFGLLIIQLVLFIMMYIFILHQIGLKIPKFKNIREYISFGVPTIPGNLSTWIVDLSDRYIIGIILGMAYVGYYSPGYTLGNMIVMFMAPFATILTPMLSSYHDESDVKNIDITLKYSLKYLLLLSIPAVFGLSLLSKSILTLLTTPEIALNSYLITPFIAVSAFLYGVYGIISHILVIEKKTKIIGTMWIIAGLLNIILNILFVPYFGIIAAAIMTLIAYTFTFIVTLYYSLKYHKFEFDLRFILKSIAASMVMSLIIVLVNPIRALDILIVIFVCSITYIVVLFLLKGIEKEEIEFFKKMIRKG